MTIATQKTSRKPLKQHKTTETALTFLWYVLAWQKLDTQGLVLVKVLRQLLRAKLIKHFKQTCKCLNNGQYLSVSTNKLIQSAWTVRFWSYSALVCWVTLYFYFLWAPIPCCNLLLHEQEEFTACDLPTLWSLSASHHSRDRQRWQGQSRSEQEPKTIMNLILHIVSYLPHMLFTSHLQSCFL